MKKGYGLFTREAEELRNQLEELLDQDEKIEEAVGLFKMKKEEWSQRFKKVEETGAKAMEEVKRELKKWSELED